MNTDTINRQFLLQELFRIVPLKVRGYPAYIYLEPLSVDAVSAQLERLEPLVRTILPPRERHGLYDHRTKHKARLLARLILRANNISHVAENHTIGRIDTTRWNLGPFNAPLHSPLLWPENGGIQEILEPTLDNPEQ